MLFHSQDYSSSRISSCGEHAVTLVLCLLSAAPVNVAVLELSVPGIEVSIVSHLLPALTASQKQEFQWFFMRWLI